MTFLWSSVEHERRWNETISNDPNFRLSALDFWARRLNELPAPVLFTASRAERLSGQWQRLMRASMPYCTCGERRWLLPEHSVAFHPPKSTVPIIVGAGAQIALGAWGADTQQTQIQISVENGFIATHMLPYSTLSRAELMALGVDAIGNVKTGIDEEGRLYIRGIKLGGPIVRDSLEELAKHIAEVQRPVNRLVAIKREGTNQALLWAMYQVARVDLKVDIMEVVVSATVQVMDRSKRASFHICTQ